MSTETMWYLAELQTRTQHQELTLEQAKALLAGVDRSTLGNWVAWHEGMAQWTKVMDLPELAPARPAPPPLPDFLPVEPASAAAAPAPEPTQQLQQKTSLLARERTVEIAQYQAQLQAQQQAAAILAQQEAAAHYAQQQAYLAQQQAAQLAQFQPQQAAPAEPAALPGVADTVVAFTPAPEAETDWAALRTHPRYAVRLKVVVVSQQRTFRSFTRDISLGGCLLENEVPWSVLGGICQVYISNPEGAEAIEFSAQVLSDPRNPCRLMFREQDSRTQGKLDSWLATMTVARRRVA